MVLDQTGVTITNQIYDIYVIKTSGLPLFAGCTVTEYCKNHMGQHELISGFFSALLSFSEESFKDDELETVLYQDVQLNFVKDDDYDLIFIFIHDRNSEIEKVRDDLNRARQIFIDEYDEHLDTLSIDQTLFDDYRDLLDKAGIIDRSLQDTSAMMEVKDKHKQDRPRLVQWIKGLFS